MAIPNLLLGDRVAPCISAPVILSGAVGVVEGCTRSPHRLLNQGDSLRRTLEGNAA
jgi:hypothetical protein